MTNNLRTLNLTYLIEIVMNKEVSLELPQWDSYLLEPSRQQQASSGFSQSLSPQPESEPMTQVFSKLSNSKS